MIIVALADRYKELPVSGDYKWCYMGKDAWYRERICGVLGEKSRFFLKDRLYKVAEKVRRPFLDYVSKIGRLQKNKLNWWASMFASRSPYQTDFFQFLCYRHLTGEIVEEFREKDEKMFLLVDDHWLYRELRESYSGKEGVRFHGRDRLLVRKAYSLLRGTVFRVLLLGWFVVAKWLVYYHHRGKSPEALKTSGEAVVILSYPETKAFRDGKYVDRYTGKLFKLLEDRGIPYFYLWYLMSPLSTARLVGGNRKVLWPLILDVRFKEVLKRLFSHWDITLPEDGFSPGTKEYSLKYLIARQRWIEYADTGFVTRLILFDTLKRFFSRKWCRCVVYVFENQPFEKILCMAASESGVKLTGYQHSSIGRLYLSQFPGGNEAGFMPLPEKILTVGEYFATLYKEEGMPEHKVASGGAWRFPHLTSLNTGQPTRHRAGDRPVILVSLTLDIPVSKSLLKAVFNTFSKYEEDFELLIKAHPDVPFERLGIEQAPVKYRVVDIPLNELFNRSDVVITSMSTSSIEAYLYGKKVVSYMPENLVVYDPAMDIKGETVLHWYEGEVLDMEFIKKTDCAVPPEEERRKYFEEINERAWLDSVSGCLTEGEQAVER